MPVIFQVLMGGAIGALSRYGVCLLLPASDGTRFPWATFAVNILGCLLIGIALGLVTKGTMTRLYWPLLVTGFLGGFTTFSSFGLETIQLFQNKQFALALYYLLGSNLAGLLLVFAGYRIISQ
ncbi:MAG TPA: fluoride efflux transporter CrcB [Bacteroidia bacterium]|nr:fluoride efflux transporter CrcB [Bacteroidia bacterium]